MENCKVRYKGEIRSFATENVTSSALSAIFKFAAQSCFLKDRSGTYVFHDESGIFPILDPFQLYEIETIGGELKTQASTSDLRSKFRHYVSSDDSESSSDDLVAANAYKQATLTRKCKGKGKRKSTLVKSKAKGKRHAPEKSPEVPVDSWFFKISVGKFEGKKKVAVHNCMIRCNSSSSCASVKQELARELNTNNSYIRLYDSDYLEITDSPGRVGKYWSGTRKIFVVLAEINMPSSHTSQPTSQSTVNLSPMKNALNLLSGKVESMNNKLEKTQSFMSKGADSVYKDIAIFVRDMLKCPICCCVTKDEIPHAIACCNNVYCQDCINQLVAREEAFCPLCKQRRGPLYPILLRGMQELSGKVSLIPEEIDDPDATP